MDIDGVEVLFPHQAYGIQVDYMKSIIHCCQQKVNGLLESPTGTGKTLCILCSSMAWIKTFEPIMRQSVVTDEEGVQQEIVVSDDSHIPRIVYSSRTHCQLSQCCQQLKRTHYKTERAVVIASREQLCLRPDVRSLSGTTHQSMKCSQLKKEGKCVYFQGFDQKVKSSQLLPEVDQYYASRDDNDCKVMDIEDLVDFGSRHTCCPYYGAREMARKASVVFTPYTYLLDPGIREANKMMGISLKNSVVVIDEGHHTEQSLEDCMSAVLTTQTLDASIKRIDLIVKMLETSEDKLLELFPNSSPDVQDVRQLGTCLRILRTHINRKFVSKPVSKPPTEALFELLNESGLGFPAIGKWIAILDDLCDIHVDTGTSSLSVEPVWCLKLMRDFFCKIYPKCMSASVGAKSLIAEDIHCLIITSGTLSPMESFNVEMDIKFNVKLQNNHIIGDNQLSIINICRSRDNMALNSLYRNRTESYYIALGQTLIEILRAVPKGVLVFFTCYEVLNNCTEIWKQNTNDNIWDKLNAVKEIFLETKCKHEFNDCFLKYKQKVDENQSSGAVFFGVFRGKLSEGMDLPDDYCRGVIMTGLPFPAVMDPKVKLKKQYLNNANTELTFDEWYGLQMKRALNQAIGRVVRHKDDFGVVILMDSRFPSYSDGLSKWIETFIEHNDNNQSPYYVTE
ncbi:unnamed protein product, partial [Oppiella nova]